MLEYGHIAQRVRKSGLHSPANRYSGKTSFLSPRDWPKFITQQRSSQDLSCYESKALRRSESAMGKAKTYRRQSSKEKERRTHTSGPKETFPTNESSVGGKKKSCWQEITDHPRLMKCYRLAVVTTRHCSNLYHLWHCRVEEQKRHDSARVNCREIIADNVSKPGWSASQRLIPTGEQSGLLMRSATMECGFLLAPTKS
jgi:hypothetical protein